MKNLIILLFLLPLMGFSQLDTVLVGAYARDPQADNIREAFIKVNDAILELNDLIEINFDSLFLDLDNQINELHDTTDLLRVEISILNDSISVLRSDLSEIEAFLLVALSQLEIELADPDSLAPIIHSTDISWRWSSVLFADGYIFSTTTDILDGVLVDTNYYNEVNLTCETSYTRYIWAYNESDTSDILSITSTTGTCFVCGTSLAISHIEGSVAPVNKSTTYGTVTNVPGETSKCWITSNLGSDNQASASNDATEASAGWYWQFNRIQGYKHTGSTRTPSTTWITTIDEPSDWTIGNDPCISELGDGWRLPTALEWSNVDAAGSWNGDSGPWNSLLKLHKAGYLDSSAGDLQLRGTIGYYWSSTQSLTNYGRDIYFMSGACDITIADKSHGYPVRCIFE